MLQSLLIAAAVVVVLWAAFVAFVFVARPDETSMHDAVRLLPDTARLLHKLASDHTIPRRTRWLVWALLGYLALPIDLIPDFVPVVGYADDAVLTSIVLRRVVHRAGAGKVQQHWPGSPEGLSMLRRLLRLTSR